MLIPGKGTIFITVAADLETAPLGRNTNKRATSNNRPQVTCSHQDEVKGHSRKHPSFTKQGFRKLMFVAAKRQVR